MGAPNKKIAGKKKAGGVVVLKGSALGVIGRSSRIWTQKSGAIAGSAEAKDRFGLGLATGDFNGDGKQDLAIAAPDEGLAGKSKAGAAWVLRGASELLTGKGAKMFSESTSGIAGSIGVKDRFGSDLAGGDYNDDGFDDLAVGVPYEDVKGKGNAGVIIVLKGSAAGLTGTSSQRWHEDRTGVGGVVGGGDRFGTQVTALSATSDNRWDLLIGIPFQNTGGAIDSGAVLFLRGGNSGLTATGDKVLHQNISGASDTPEANDKFGLGL